jgi:hypothetical protein
MTAMIQFKIRDGVMSLFLIARVMNLLIDFRVFQAYR